MENPSIYPFGLRIDEPVTTLTDIVVALVCWYAWWRLRPYRQPLEMRYFRAFFLLMGVATILGGVAGHGFLYALSFYWKLPGWLLSMVSITLLERAVIFYSRSLLHRSTRHFFYWFNILELVVFAGLAFSQLEFRFVEIHSAYGLMVVVLGFCLYNLYRGRDNRSIRLFIAGVVLSIIAAVIFTGRISISQWFNYIDISHVLMAGTAWLLYRGARLIGHSAQKT